MIECLAVECPPPSSPAKYQTLTTEEFRLHVSSAFDSKSKQVSPGRI
jgi:hypothetical protein